MLLNGLGPGIKKRIYDYARAICCYSIRSRSRVRLIYHVTRKILFIGSTVIVILFACSFLFFVKCKIHRKGKAIVRIFMSKTLLVVKFLAIGENTLPVIFNFAGGTKIFVGLTIVIISFTFVSCHLIYMCLHIVKTILFLLTLMFNYAVLERKSVKTDQGKAF